MKKLKETQIVERILFDTVLKIDNLQNFDEQEKKNFKRLLSVFAEKIIFSLANQSEDIFSQIAKATKPEGDK